MLNEWIFDIHCRIQDGILDKAEIQQIHTGTAILIVEMLGTSIPYGK